PSSSPGAGRGARRGSSGGGAGARGGSRCARRVRDPGGEQGRGGRRRGVLSGAAHPGGCRSGLCDGKKATIRCVCVTARGHSVTIRVLDTHPCTIETVLPASRRRVAFGAAEDDI